MSSNQQTGPERDAPIRHYPALRFDAQEYLKFIEDEDLSEAQALELLGAIWEIMVGFVDLGLGIHPVQNVVGGLCEKLAPDSPPALHSEEQQAIRDRKFAAAGAIAPTAEREDS